MTEVSNFSEAWDAYVNQHGNPPKDANQLHKYSKNNKAIKDLTYPLARLQFVFNTKVVQAAANEISGDSNSIEDEIKRLKKNKDYLQLPERDFFEFGRIHRDKRRMKFMQYNVTLDKLIGKQIKAKRAKNEDEKSESKEQEISSPEQWHFRGFRIIEIIAKYEPDIISLQELNHFQFMCHYLKPLGYKGVFKMNTKSKLLEGVAIFYNTAEYEKVTTFMYGKDVEKGTNFDLCAISLVLRHTKSDEEIVVCSANLKTLSKMSKLMHLMASLNDISSNNNDAPIFMGCDLGSDAFSDEYDSIQRGRMFLENNKNVPKGYEEGFGLQLCSAYYPSFYKGKVRSSEPASTVFGGKCRDYIFMDEGKGASCSNVLQIPTAKEIKQHKKYPNWQSPSEHFPLLAQLFF